MVSPYQPLADYLAAQPAATATITLTIAEVEAVVGAPLPAAVWTRTWWSKARPGRQREARPWLTAGWRVARLSLRTATPTVTFARLSVSPDSGTPGPSDVDRASEP
jgi:hypothetical protein